MSTVRDRLRAATADAHAALEAALDLANRIRTRADLAAVLARFHGFFQPLEQALDAALGPPVMAGRHRVPALRADLETLGLDAAAIAALPLCARAALATAIEPVTPSVSGPAALRAPPAGACRGPSAAWGALYVVEGARLGGRLIARDLAQRGIAHGLRFWADAAPAPSWPDFLRALEDVPDPALAAAGALATFNALHQWMCAPPPPG